MGGGWDEDAEDGPGIGAGEGPREPQQAPAGATWRMRGPSLEQPFFLPSLGLRPPSPPSRAWKGDAR